MTLPGPWRFWLLWGLVAVLALAGVWLLERTFRAGDPQTAGSTFGHNTRGSQALLQLARSQNVGPVQRRRPFLDPLPAETAQIWIIAPYFPLQIGESARLRDWVADGGTLILISRGSGSTATLGPGSEMLTESLIGLLEEASPVSHKLSRPETQALLPLTEMVSPAHPIPVRGDEPLLALSARPVIPGHPLCGPPAPLPALPVQRAGNWELAVTRADPLKLKSDHGWIPLWNTDVGPVLAERTLGKGKIIYGTQPEWFCNALLTSPECATIATRLLLYRTRPGATEFSEFHHGFRGRLRGFSDLAGAAWGQALLWLGIVLALALWSYGVRFAAPAPPAAPPVPDPAGYVEALGRLYQRAGALEIVHYNLAACYRRLVQLPPDTRTGGAVPLVTRPALKARLEALLRIKPERRTASQILDALRTDPQ